MSHKALLQKIWAEVYAPQADVEALIKEYFHPDFDQSINGVTLRRDAYIEHVIEQKKNIVLESIDYRHILEQGDELFALYYPTGKNFAGQPILAEVIAYFKFKEDQIIHIHGSVRMIEGKPSDADM